METLEREETRARQAPKSTTFRQRQIRDRNNVTIKTKYEEECTSSSESEQDNDLDSDYNPTKSRGKSVLSVSAKKRRKYVDTFQDDRESSFMSSLKRKPDSESPLTSQEQIQSSQLRAKEVAEQISKVMSSFDKAFSG